MTGGDCQPTRASTGQVFLAAALLTLALSELTRIFVTEQDGSLLSRLAFVALCLGLVARVDLREWVMALMALALAAGLWLRGDINALL